MGNKFTKKAEDALHKVVEAFRDGKIAESCALATFPMPEIPASKWTLANRWLAFAQSGEVDCRGFRQWKQVGRSVVKGGRAVYILRPCMAKKKADDSASASSSDDGKKEVCIGFAPVAVFGVEQTDGEPLEYDDIEVPDVPLLEVARAWGIDVSAMPLMGNFLGRFRVRSVIGRDDEREDITLCSPEASVFHHELAHASHARVIGGLEGGQDPIQEIVAEFSAEVLRRMFGSDKDTSGHSYEYIERYAAQAQMTVLDACLKVLHETAKVVGLILETADAVSGETEAVA